MSIVISHRRWSLARSLPIVPAAYSIDVSSMTLAFGRKRSGFLGRDHRRSCCLRGRPRLAADIRHRHSLALGHAGRHFGHSPASAFWFRWCVAR